ncbi:hypothetical protein ACIQNG_33880 [Streptomyces sp. NPDC091377]|uniref:hypothetical protein n=1 Tax=Streptomyces sp. NPDC091377 TaxID=3365995 RepID=UPI0038150280
MLITHRLGSTRAADRTSSSTADAFAKKAPTKHSFATNGECTARRGTRAVPAAGPAVMEADDVTYTYPGASRPALDGVSVTCRFRECVSTRYCGNAEIRAS